MSFSQEVGARLKVFRAKKNLTQEKVAEMLGLSSKQSINGIEKGRNRISIDHIKILHDEYGLDVNWLITGKESGGSPSVEALEKALAELAEQSAHIRKLGDLIMEKFNSQ